MTFLAKDIFTTVIKSTPLISIDLIVENENGELLFGLRNNKPAKGYWFVPGGRVLKNETLDNAFKRLTYGELGVELDRSNANLAGIYEHFYDDFVFGDSVSTHYVVVAHLLKVSSSELKLPVGDQHNTYIWKSKEKILQDPNIHQYSKAYVGSV